MEYALVNDIRQEAFAGGKGKCPICFADVIAKCGNRIVHHWAHAHRQNCDPWWENETPWHRDWKNQFTPECREVIHTGNDGEIHRADVKTLTSNVIEFQHSQITDEERLSRELFYKNLVWVIDGSGFKDNFDLLHMLPAPDSELAKDLVWSKGKRHLHGAAAGLFWRLSENPGHAGNPNAMVEIHGINKIRDEVEAAYQGHHQYDWIRPRSTWLNATCPVYIDFGDQYLVRLETYGDVYPIPCVRLISKRKFLHDVQVETNVKDIATRFTQSIRI
jgi:competence protein CoiA